MMIESTMLIPSIIAWGGIGGGELLLICFVILLVFGPKRLPELARALGQAKREFGKAAEGATEEIHKLIETPSADSSKSSNGSSVNTPVKKV